MATVEDTGETAVAVDSRSVAIAIRERMARGKVHTPAVDALDDAMNGG